MHTPPAAPAGLRSSSLPPPHTPAPPCCLDSLALADLPHLLPCDVEAVARARPGLRHLSVAACPWVGEAFLLGLPLALARPQLSVRWRE